MANLKSTNPVEKTFPERGTLGWGEKQELKKCLQSLQRYLRAGVDGDEIEEPGPHLDPVISWHTFRFQYRDIYTILIYLYIFQYRYICVADCDEPEPWSGGGAESDDPETKKDLRQGQALDQGLRPWIQGLRTVPLFFQQPKNLIQERSLSGNRMVGT